MVDLSDVDRHSPTRHRLLLIDVESAPMLAYLWDLKADYVNPQMIVEPPFLLTWAAKWWGDDHMMSARLTGREAKAQDDARIVSELADLVREADIVCGHNIDKFDLPKLNGQVAVHELLPLGNVKTLDTLKLARQSFKLPSNRLGEVAKALGVETKLDTTFDLWRRARAGDVPALKEMDAYCQQDVVVLEQVFDRLRPYAKKLPRLVDAGQYGQRCCPYCGSSDLDKLDKPYRTDASTFDRFRCGECGRECRSFRQTSDPKLETRPI
jgi:hypothetical protein